GRQAEAPRILRKVGVRLGREVAARAEESRRLDVEAAARGRNPQHARAQRAPLGMTTEGILDCGNAVVEAEQLEDLAARQDPHLRPRCHPVVETPLASRHASRSGGRIARAPPVAYQAESPPRTYRASRPWARSTRVTLQPTWNP